MGSDTTADELVLRLLGVGPDAVPVAALWAVDVLTDVDVAEVVGRLESAGHVRSTGDGLLRADSAAGRAATAGLGAVAVARLRGSLGRALRDNAAVRPTEVAALLVDGLVARPDPTVLPWVIDSGNRLVRDGRLDESIELLEIARAAVDRGAPLPPVARVRLLGRLSYLLRWVGRAADAEALLDQTLAVARTSGEADQIGVAALTWTPRSFAVSDDPANSAILDDALARLPETDSAMRPLLLAARSSTLVFTDLDAARQAADEALTSARDVDDAETFILAAYASRVAYWHPSEQARNLALANEMVARAPQAVDYTEYGALARLQIFLETGDFEHLDGELAAMGRRLARHPRPFEELWFRTVAAARAIVLGEWEVAGGHTDRALALGDGAAYDMGYQLLLSQAVLVAWHRGDDLTGLADHAVPAGPLRRSWEACLLGWTCTRMAAADVEAELDRLLPDGMASIRPDLTFGPVTSSLAMAAAECGAARHARVLHDGLLPYVDQWAGTGGAVSNGPFALHVGRLAATIGRDDEAAVLLDDALDRCRRAGSIPWEARTELALGRLCDGGDGPAHLARAAALADGIGMAEVADIARRHRGDHARPAGLSPREVEVLTLLARGATNRQIAEELFLSVKTVERHLLNTYRKIDARGRAEATAFALRNGLA